jgi:hypothetical protein
MTQQIEQVLNELNKVINKPGAVFNMGELVVFMVTQCGMEWQDARKIRKSVIQEIINQTDLS